MTDRRRNTPQPPKAGLGSSTVSAALMSHAGQTDPIMPDFEAVRRSLSDDETTPVALARAFNGIRSRQELEKELIDARRKVADNPDSAVVHLNLANALSQCGDVAGAIAVYRRCAEAQSPEVVVSARYFLAALGASEQPSTAPELYVSALFDQFADSFEHNLVQILKYQGPIALHQAVGAVLGGATQELDIMDAGCGTGLCGQMFQPMARRLDGVDISEKMLGHAREKRIYDKLIRGELCSVIRNLPGAYDLVVAGDVLIYLGEPAAVLDAVACALRPAGLFAFTTECAASGCRLIKNGRYQHSDAYVEAAALDAGFHVVHRDAFMVRTELGEAVDGAVFVLSRA